MKPDHSQSLLKMKYAGLSENYDRLVNDFNRLQEQHERLQDNFTLLSAFKMAELTSALNQKYARKRPKVR